jgi:hypothetical protein
METLFLIDLLKLVLLYFQAVWQDNIDPDNMTYEVNDLPHTACVSILSFCWFMYMFELS